MSLLGAGIVNRHMPQPRPKLDPEQSLRFACAMALAWSVFNAVLIALQTAGMRWMLRSTMV
jgi:hypothetical protein